MVTTALTDEELVTLVTGLDTSTRLEIELAERLRRATDLIEELDRGNDPRGTSQGANQAVLEG
jgi:hypothetical protein